MKKTSTCIAIVAIFASVLSMQAYAEDSDFDYEPPEELGIFGRFTEFFADVFRSPSHAGSYSTAKKRMYRHLEDSHSLYCGCETNLEAREFDSGVCGYIPNLDNDRAGRLEAEHVLPAFWIAKFHTGASCWVKEESCGSARECCLTNDARFKKAHNDLVNLIPAIGELNGARSNLLYSTIPEEARVFGSCDFEVDRELDLTEPRADIRGDIARIYFYMADTYDLRYPDELATLLDTWNDIDAVSQSEINRNDRVHSVQGTANELVSSTVLD